MNDTKVKRLTSAWATSSEFNVILVLVKKYSKINKTKFFKDKLQ